MNFQGMDVTYVYTLWPTKTWCQCWKPNNYILGIWHTIASFKGKGITKVANGKACSELIIMLWN